MGQRFVRLCVGAGLGLAAALLLGGRPRPSHGAPGAGGAGLVFGSSERDLGQVDLHQAVEVEVDWRREGAGPLRVLAVQTGCGCASAAGLPGVLGEGTSGALKVRLAPRQDLGPFQVAVRVHLDAPAPRDVATWRVRGYVGGLPVVRPDVLDLGARAPGVSVTRRLELSTPPGEDPLSVTARLEGLSGAVLLVPPGIAGRQGRDLLVTCDLPDRPGPLEGRVLVQVGRRAPFPVPVRGLVVAPPDAEGGAGPVR